MFTIRAFFRFMPQSFAVCVVSLVFLALLAPLGPSRAFADDLPYLPTPDAAMPAPEVSEAPAALSDVSIFSPFGPPAPIGVPMRLRIPSVGIDAAVENVGLDGEGAMDTPRNFDNTAWYAPGPRPGEQGNAVINGHVDSAALKRGAVFWNLRQVQPGNLIIVISDDDTEHRFFVTSVQTYTAQNAPVSEIFGPADGAHLNLITCDANTPFNRRTGEYSGWLLVTADVLP